MKKILENIREMKPVINTACWLIFFTVAVVGYLNVEYDKLDAYNKASHDFQWVSRLEPGAYYVCRMGKSSEYYIGVSTDYGDGVIDRNGKEILPTDYEAVDFKGGDYIAAATMYNWMLFDAKGNEIASFNRNSFPYAYAGDRYFIRYGNDHIEDISDGIAIIDAVSGEEVRKYEDCYNAVRLDDGNWYISDTVDINGIAARWVLNGMSFYESTDITEIEKEERKGAPYGFFTDEKLQPLFDEKAYRLICQGDGLYVAKIMEKGREGEVVTLNGKGELFAIEDETLLKRIRYYENNGDIVINTTTVFKTGEGNIGFKSLKSDGETIYLDKEGNLIEAEQYEPYEAETETAEMELRRQLSPAFSEAELLPGTDNILVNGDMGCGLIRWEGDRT